jgi:CheY-like chemotaxis protein
MEDALSAEEGL